MYKLENKISKHKSQVTDEGYEKIVTRGWKGRYKVLEHIPDDPNAKPAKVEKTFSPPEVSLTNKTVKPDTAKTAGKSGKRN